MDCPRDQSPLQTQGYWKFPRYACGKCRGFLVGEKAVAEALGMKPGAFHAAVGEKIPQLPVGTLACPHDGTLMRVMVHKGVEVDLCPSCRAVWLDTGEYEKVATPKPRNAPTGTPRSSLAEDAGDAAVEVAGDVAGEGLLQFVGEAIGALLG